MKTVEDVANGGGPCDRYVSRSGIALASRLRTWRKSLIEPWPRQLDRENSTARRAQEPPTARWVLALALDWLSSRANNVLKGGRRNTSMSSPMRRRAGETNMHASNYL